MRESCVTMPNKLHVLMHRMPSMATVSVCFYMMSGARNETAGQAGAAHLLEHMLFRGSRRYPVEAIRERMRKTGSDMNAFTTWEGTCVYARMLPEHFGEIFPVLADMVRHPRLDEAEFEVERSIVQEELARQLDEPRSRMLHELHRISCTGRLGGNVIGSREEIAALRLSALRDFHRTHYAPDNVLLVLTGAFEQEQVEEALACLEDWLPDGAPREGLFKEVMSPGETGASAGAAVRLQAPFFRKGTGLWGWRLPPLHGADHYTAHLLCTLLGDDNMTGSRFESSLVRSGIAEQANTVYTSYAGGGMLKIYSTFPEGRETAVMDTVTDELWRLRDGKGDPAELRRAKNKMKTQIAVDASTTDSRMISMAQAWLPGREMVPLQELLDRIEALTYERLGNLAGMLLKEEPFAVIGEPSLQKSLKE